MDNAHEMQDWIGRNVVDADGSKIGRIDDLYMDDDTGRPEWFAVSTGWFGRRISFVPIAGADPSGDDVRVRWSKDTVKDSPHIDPDQHLSNAEEAELYAHYGMSYERQGLGDRTDRDTGRKADDAMTRSEEELRVGKTREEAGRVRLRKWVETEHAGVNVPVSREEARIEREPITSENVDEAMSGPEISEGEHEVTLHEEHVVANKEVVPKERVKLEKETVTDEEPVSADLRKERVEVEGGRDRPNRR